MCPASATCLCLVTTDLLWAGLLLVVVAFSIYLGARTAPNPYDKRQPWKDAKDGNIWARLAVGSSVLFGALIVAHFVCLFIA